MDTPQPENTPDNPPLHGFWKTVLPMFPIVLTILATAFAGLSSSEMTQAMYWRTLASQNQSKAGDQWAFFQAKRIRGTTLESSAELLDSLGRVESFEPSKVDPLASLLLDALAKSKEAKEIPADEQKNVDEAISLIQKARESWSQFLAKKTTEGARFHTSEAMPKIEIPPLPNKETQDAINSVAEAIHDHKSEAATKDTVRKLRPADVDEAIRLAEEAPTEFDKAIKPTQKVIEEYSKVFRQLTEATRLLRRVPTIKGENGSRLEAALNTFEAQSKGFRMAIFEFNARRYKAEASYNQRIAELFEVRVRQSSSQSDRFRERSKLFFYSMLVAQMGVTVSSLALAHASRKSLWLLAAGAGLISLVFTGYVWLTL